ncbi:MAG: hypothetical protein ACK2U1_08045 [Anaerolineales bacterium]|jgi:hypothetical protein
MNQTLIRVTDIAKWYWRVRIGACFLSNAINRALAGIRNLTELLRDV